MAMDLTPRALDDGTLLYATPTAAWRRWMLTVAAAGIVLILATAFLGAVIVTTAFILNDRFGLLFLVVLGFLTLMVLGAVVPLVWLVVLVRRTVFAVTTEGLTLTPPFGRPRHVPWAEVAHLEVADGMYMAGAVVVVTSTGERITASRTNGPDPQRHFYSATPASARTGLVIPFNAAQDALERYRRGEFTDGQQRHDEQAGTR